MKVLQLLCIVIYTTTTQHGAVVVRATWVCERTAAKLSSSERPTGGIRASVFLLAGQRTACGHVGQCLHTWHFITPPSTRRR